MIFRAVSILIRLLRCESGQMLPVMTIMLVALLGMTGIAVDVGRVLYTKRQLQASTDAATLAGAATLPNSSATTVATQYSAVTGNLNAQSNLSGVTMVTGYPKILCLSTLTAQGIACAAPGYGNAIQVQQQTALPLTFLRVIGVSSITIRAIATASSKGATRPPYNVAIIVDTTGSMGSTDSDSNCNASRLSCALSGVQVLLQNLSPCGAAQSTCGIATSGNVANPVDRVALYTFPALASATDVQHEYDCSGTTPKAGLYTDPTMPLYQVVDYSSDYKTSATTMTLNSASNLVKAVGGAAGCTGMQTLSGVSTYIAGVMYKAGSDLISMQSSYPNSQGVVVILTDGDMNAPPQNLPNASTTSGTYASTKNECQQAVTLASYAAQYNIRVYSVAYGATSSGCSTDTSGITPCQTVQQLASSPQNFYSDYTASGGSSNCVSAAHSTTNLNQIFTQIANDLSTSRLIPDNTT